MKTFNKKDLITWSNRHDVNVGDKGYFAHSIDDLDINIENGYVHKLINISNYYACCFAYDSRRGYGFFLPKEAVKENKTYRACRTIQELYELVFNCKSKVKDISCIDDKDRFCINELVGTVIHFRHKKNKIQFYEQITGIIAHDNGYIVINICSSIYELSTLFNDYEIEINGEWVPFGVLKK